MELNVRKTFVDFEHDSTIASDRLTNFEYVSKGGFALVFLASFRRTDGTVQPVAVKVLKPENHFRPAHYSKFLQEVAFQTALPHPYIVRALGFCSVPVGQLVAAAPPEILTPSASTSTSTSSSKPAAVSAREWFAQRRLEKCWALVMELMPDGNLFDYVVAASRGAATRQAWGPQAGTLETSAAVAALRGSPNGLGRGASGPCNGIGSYTDAQGLLWLIDVADAMTFLHSRQPLLIHRDLKLENILLRRESDGLLRAKLSDFGLTVAVDTAGCKVPLPQVLRAPGQSLEDVTASVPGGGSIRPAAAPTEELRGPSRAADAAPPAGPTGLNPIAIGMHPAVPGTSPDVNASPQDPWDPQQRQRQLRADRKVLSTSQLPISSTVQRGGSQRLLAEVAAAAMGGSGPVPVAPLGKAPRDIAQEQRQVGVGQPGVRPWSAAQAYLQLPAQLSERGVAGAGAGAGGGLPRPGAGTAATVAQLEGEKLLRPQRSSISWTGMQRTVTNEGSGDDSDCQSGMPTLVGPHGLHPVASHGYLLPKPQAPNGRLPLVALRASSSRRSETGHLQVKMDQVNGLLQLCMGHKDYLPDLYQMTFRLTSQCGSVCYMAPEVARQQPYNQKADVFSFGCIIFEVMTRQLLSDGIPDGDVDAALEYLSRVSWIGWRPDLPTWLPKELRLLISLCWHREPRLRPSFSTIATRLREALLAVMMPSPLQPKSSLPPPEHQQRNASIYEQQLHLKLKLMLQLQQQRNKEQQQKAQQQARSCQQLRPLPLIPCCPEQTRCQQADAVQMQGSANNNGASVWSGLRAGAPFSGAGNMAVANLGHACTAQMGGMAQATTAAAVAQSQLGTAWEQQLQLQLHQLNAYTHAAAASAAATSCGVGSILNTAFALPFSPSAPYTANSVASRLTSLVESSCATMTYTATTGCRVSSSVFGGPGGRGGLPSLETATTTPQRPTANTLITVMTVPQNSDGGDYSSPSPVSPSCSKGATRRSSTGPSLGPGSEGPTTGGSVFRSEGTGAAASGGSSFRVPRSTQLLQQQLLERGKGQQGCTSMCITM